MTKEEKKDKILDLYTELVKSGDNVIRDFFDLSSDKMLDKKIDVLTKLKNGVKPSDIPDFYEVLEEYPGDDVDWGAN